MSDQLSASMLEKTVLGLALGSAYWCQRVLKELSAESFAEKGNAEIFRALEVVVRAGGVGSAQAVALQVADISAVGGVGYLSECVEMAEGDQDGDFYIAKVNEFHGRRLMGMSALRLLDMVKKTDVPLSTIIDNHRRVLQGASELVGAPAEPSHIGYGAREFAAFLKGRQAAISEGRLREVMGPTTGFRDIDAMVEGLSPGQLFVVGGVPGAGKTAISTNICEYTSGSLGIPCAFFSLEMTRLRLLQRLVCSRAGVSSRRATLERMSEQESRRILEATAYIEALPMYIVARGSLFIDEIIRETKELVETKGVRLIVIDYLQKVKSRTSAGSIGREQIVAEISRSLQALAIELNICVMCLAQLNRKWAGRADGRPIAADLRDSGQIEQDADVIMMLYADKEKPGLVEVNIVKNRHGEVGMVTLEYDGPRTKFSDLKPMAELMPEYGGRLFAPD